MLFVAINDHTRLAFTAMERDDKTPQAVRDAVACCEGLGVKVEQLLTDNRSTFRSKDFAQAFKQLNICHRFRGRTCRKLMGRPSASFNRRCAIGLRFTCQHSSERKAAL